MTENKTTAPADEPAQRRANERQADYLAMIGPAVVAAEVRRVNTGRRLGLTIADAFEALLKADCSRTIVSAAEVLNARADEAGHALERAAYRELALAVLVGRRCAR